MKVPWADLNRQFTVLFERFAIDVLLSASSKSKAADLLGLSWDEVHHIQKRAVQRGLERRDISEISHLGIDEKAFLKGHHYASLLYNIDNKRVFDVVEHRTKEAASELLKAPPEEVKSGIEAIGVDMWDPFLPAIKENLPDAEIVHDKYHIVSYLTKAVDVVRRKEHKSLKVGGDDVLKGTKYLWLKNPDNWPEQNQASFDELQSIGFKVGRARAFKETFQNLRDYSYQKSAKKFFDGWYWWATHLSGEVLAFTSRILSPKP